MEIDSDRDAMEEDGGDEGSAEEGKSPETVSLARCTRSMLTELIVQSIDVDQTSERGTKRMLPKEVHDGKRWKTLFVLTILKYLGTRTDPWESPSIPVIQRVWDCVYHTDKYGTPFYHQIAFGDDIYYLVCRSPLRSSFADHIYVAYSQGL